MNEFKPGNKQDKSKLNERQKAFIDFYIQTGNLSESARKAGYSAKNASATGIELLKNPKIQAAIQLRVVVNVGTGKGFTRAEKIKAQVSAKERLKAAEMLAKVYMDFEKFFSSMLTPKNTENKNSMRRVVGGGYDEFWRSKQRYVVCKGSRASKKSTTAALKLIVRLMQMPLANALVVRQTAAALKDSCYAQLQSAINRLGVEKFWKCTVNPLQMTYIPTGQKIIFRGMTIR